MFQVRPQAVKELTNALIEVWKEIFQDEILRAIVRPCCWCSGSRVPPGAGQSLASCGQSEYVVPE